MVVIAAVSESAQSREVALKADELAQAFSDELHLVHVLEESEYTRIVEQQSEQRRTETGDIAENAATEATASFVEELHATNETVGRIGTPGSEVVAYANEVDAQYLVVGGRTRSPVGKALFGSITQSILLESECPVVTVTVED